MKYIIGLFVAIAIIPALLPSQFTISRKTIINHSIDDTFAYLVNLESWKEWSPWLEQDPGATQTFDGIPGVVGSSTTWDGEIIGAGKQTLTQLETPKYLETKLEFTRPNESEATGYMKLQEMTQGTQITWGLKGELSYPIERIFGLFMDSMVGDKFERGLTRLKQRLEVTDKQEAL